jgi:hypothetical protein
MCSQTTVVAIAEYQQRPSCTITARCTSYYLYLTQTIQHLHVTHSNNVLKQLYAVTQCASSQSSHVSSHVALEMVPLP